MIAFIGVILAGPRYWCRLWARRRLLKIRADVISRNDWKAARVYGEAAISLGEELISWRRR